MRLIDLVETSVELGIALDMRGPEALRAQLDRRRAEYEALPAWQQPYYDRERFRNPFGDVRIANGPAETELRAVLLGIDIHLAEILLADRLRAGGAPLDAVIAHHAHGIGISPFLSWDSMSVMVDMLAAEGVPRADAEGAIHPYIEEKIAQQEDFHRIGPDMARLLGFPLACIHTPADYYISVGVRQALEAAGVDGAGSAGSVGDVVRALLTIPEVDSAARLGAGPRIMTGDASRAAGRILLKFGGGYILPPAAYPLLGAAGVGTVVQIACLPEHARAAAAAGVCIVRVPHAAADNIGINLLLDAVEERRGPLPVIACGAFERISRRDRAAA